MLKLITAAAKVQLRLLFRSVENLLPIIAMPMQTVIALAILKESGRLDLAGFALSASLLFTVGQMGFFVSGEIVSIDRSNQILELLVATPAPYVVILATRVLMLTSVGLFGFLEGWIVALVVFGVVIPVHYPLLFVATLVATAISGAGTSVLTAAVFGLSKNTRTLQNATNGPFYLLGGVLFPISYLPDWLQVFSPFVFFYWSANLVRDSLHYQVPQNVLFRLTMLLVVGAVAAILGGAVMSRMINRLKSDGRLGLT